jgi:hypothetical protein
VVNALFASDNAGFPAKREEKYGQAVAPPEPGQVALLAEIRKNPVVAAALSPHRNDSFLFGL